MMFSTFFFHELSSRQNSAAARLSKWLKIACHDDLMTSLGADITLLLDLSKI